MSSQRTERACQNNECAICGTNERPEKGWIYKSGDVRPVEIEDGELRFEAKEDAKAYCSNGCSQQAGREQEGG